MQSDRLRLFTHKKLPRGQRFHAAVFLLIYLPAHKYRKIQRRKNRHTDDRRQCVPHPFEYPAVGDRHNGEHRRGVENRNMLRWVSEVRSGDADNLEARAAVYYWANLFPQIPAFRRKRDGVPPNNLLNYGYAILRAVVARSLVGSGLLPTLGIHHHNRYNAYCLADDIMEPYRPYVDDAICRLLDERTEINTLSTATKTRLLTLPTTEVTIGGQRSPLMIAVAQTTASLYKCFSGECRKIIYPEM